MQQIGVYKPPPRINLGSDLACDDFRALARRTDCYLLDSRAEGTRKISST